MVKDNDVHFDYVETRDDGKTKLVMSTDDHLKQTVQSNQYNY